MGYSDTFNRSRYEAVPAVADKPIDRNEMLKQLGADSRAKQYSGMSFLPNIDQIIDRKGIETYEEMMTDAEVCNAVNSKRNAVLASTWRIIPASTDPIDVEVAAFVEWNLKNIVGSVRKSLFEILSAIYMGYSVAEKIYKVCESGQYAGKWEIAQFKAKYAGDYEIKTDEYLTITALQLTAGGLYTDVPLDKFILYTYNPKDGQPHGVSDCRSIYKHYWSKDFLLKWWNIFCETYGMPTRVAKLPVDKYSTTGSGETASQSRLQSILEDIMANTAITIPDDITIEFINAAAGGAPAFKNAIAYHDAAITKGILGQTLTSSPGAGQGSYALGMVHAETKADFVNTLQAELEDLMNEQVIRQLVEFNYSVERCPTFSMSTRTRGVSDYTADELTKLNSIGIILPADTDLIREKIGLPPVEIQVAAEAPGAPSAPELESEVPGEPGTEYSKFKKISPQKKAAIEKPVNFAKVKKDMDDGLNVAMTDLSVVVQSMKDKMMSYLPNKVFVGNKMDTNAVKNLKLIGLQDFNNIYKEITEKIAMDQLEAAYIEVGDAALARHTIQAVKHFDSFAQIVMDSRRIPEQEIAMIRKWEAAGDWAKIKAWRAANASTLQQKIAAQAFWVTDVMRNDILSEVKNQILAGVANGADVQRIMKASGQVFEKYIQRGDLPNTALASAPRLETIVRTNITRIHNDSRLVAYREGAATGNFPGLMYSATLDDRTTAFCEAADGTILAADDPEWDSLKPPNHYNCRSLLVPVPLKMTPEKWDKPPDMREIPSDFGGLK